MVGIAVVNFISRQKTQTRQGLNALLNYCAKNAKTIHGGRKLVSGVNCVAQSAYNEMMNTKLHYKKTDGRMYYHLLQSFHPDEQLTPETAHEIALRFAEENFKGYEVLVATHVDRSHIHSHLVLNSVNAENGYKYHSDNKEIQRLRDFSDKLCVEYGLSVIESTSSKVKGMSAREYRAADKGQSWKLDLAMTIDEAMCYAVSREHFIRLMEMEGYKVNWSDTRKYITYTCTNGMKCRDNKLHGNIIEQKSEILSYSGSISENAYAIGQTNYKPEYTDDEKNEALCNMYSDYKKSREKYYGDTDEINTSAIDELSKYQKILLNNLMNSNDEWEYHDPENKNFLTRCVEFQIWISKTEQRKYYVIMVLMYQ